VLHTTPIEVLLVHLHHTPLSQSADVIQSVLNTTYTDVLSFFCFVSCGSIVQFFEHSAGFGSSQLNPYVSVAN
jgi:hypothetical protein